MLRVIILAGGRGERFWPLSRRSRPKPFLTLGGRESLLRATFRRALSVAPRGAIQVAVGESLAREVRRDLRGLGGARLLLEPAARNTGPAALLAARAIWAEDPEAEILLLPSDHRVEGATEFRHAVSRARRLCRRGFLVTFGVAPGGPNPEYGYIVKGAPTGSSAWRVDRFIEKPRPAIARRLLASRRVFWNSGMFVWKAGLFLEEAARREPAFARWLEIAGTGRSISASARQAFRRLPSIPVDRAVLERSTRVAVVRAGFRWSDLGSWGALSTVLRGDKNGNLGWGDRVALNSRGNLAVNSEGLLVLWGVRDLLVVREGEAVLVCPRERAGNVREVLRFLEKAGWNEHL
jgi:mannose-1-phosphate guanylyltransferase/mannose-6-phosphate isomerase